jgi:hypothetical protein
MLSGCSRDDTLGVGVEAQPMFECVAPGKMYGNIGLAPLCHMYMSRSLLQKKLVIFKMYIKLILCIFEQLSRIKINFHKSAIYCFGKAKDEEHQYREIFGC